MGLTLPWRRRHDRDGPVPRLYAVGDVHGRLDLLEEMIQRIRLDILHHDPRPARIVILGDFVDRGPQSAQLIALLMRLRKEPGLVVLKGNHEAIMVDALAGDYAALDLWLAHGGAETLRSFGIDGAAIDSDNGPALLRLARQIVPKDVRQWLAQLPTSLHLGRYYLVHAGVRPGVALADQTDESRLWIGRDFLDSDEDHGAVIVHGHTINEDGVFIGANRIGVDTGAYRTGRLSAVCLEEEVRVLTADGSPVHG